MTEKNPVMGDRVEEDDAEDNQQASPTSPNSPDQSLSLRSIIEEAAKAEGVRLTHLTVLAVHHDPYRIDTPAFHVMGKWFADQLERLGGKHRHLRGIHYALLGTTTKPNGQPYTNSFADWEWLCAYASKAARWLGYVPFESIVDQRNAEPVIRIKSETPDPYHYLDNKAQISLNEPFIDVTPHAVIGGLGAEQPYRLAFFGEKSSLEDILSRAADRYGRPILGERRDQRHAGSPHGVCRR